MRWEYNSEQKGQNPMPYGADTLGRGEQTTNTYRNKTSGLLDSDKVGTG